MQRSDKVFKALLNHAISTNRRYNLNKGCGGQGNDAFYFCPICLPADFNRGDW